MERPNSLSAEDFCVRTTFRTLLITAVMCCLAGQAMANSAATDEVPASVQATNQTVETARYNREADGHGFTVFMQNGGWCWFQDPRAIVVKGLLYIGSVKGIESGPALVGVYDLEQGRPLGQVVMQDNFGRDDHNSPVFHARPDGSVLAVYARHNDDRYHYSRISDPFEPMQWSEEMRHERATGDEKNRVTYMNLYELRDEGLLYNFYRGIKYNPTFVTSSDHGLTWSAPTHFVQNEVDGRQRPYARYTSNGRDTLHVSFTDAHPRQFGNSIYYLAFRDGNFYRADDTLIRSLNEGPIRPSEAERIYKGSGLSGQGRYRSAPNAAWTSSIAIDQKGHPHIAYSVYHDNFDQRYRVASWDGEQWHDREVAFAGKRLYDREASYTGLISLDPVDPATVFISTDVDPSTGQETGGPHEIYRARIALGDERSTIEWQAVTANSKVRNLRPMVVRDEDQRIVLWQRGDFISYLNYDLDTVGFVEASKP